MKKNSSVVLLTMVLACTLFSTLAIISNKSTFFLHRSHNNNNFSNANTYRISENDGNNDDESIGGAEQFNPNTDYCDEGSPDYDPTYCENATCDPSSINYNVDECDAQQCDPSSVNYESDSECEIETCDPDNVNYDVDECDAQVCDDTSVNFDASLCEDETCLPDNINYDPTECAQQACDPTSINYDPEKCAKERCDPNSPNFDPSAVCPFSLSADESDQHLGMNDGTITVTVSSTNVSNDGGDYEWSCTGPNYNDAGEGDGEFPCYGCKGLGAGAYSITATALGGANSANTSTTIDCDITGVKITIPQGGIDPDDGSGTKGEIDPILEGQYIPDPANITWSITPSGTLNQDGSDVSFENLKAGDYTIAITDKYGCSVNKSVTVSKGCTDNGYSFKYFNIGNVDADINERDALSEKIDQGSTGLCGMVILAHYIACYQTSTYNSMVNDLFQNGSATSPGGAEIYAQEPLESVCPSGPKFPVSSNNDGSKMPEADCILLSSLKNTYRNSYVSSPYTGDDFYDPTNANADLDGDTPTDELKFEMINWLGLFHTYDFTYDYANYTSRGLDAVSTLTTMDSYFKQNYLIPININANILFSAINVPYDNTTTNPPRPDHWATYNGNFSYNPNSVNPTVKFDVISWGHNYTLIIPNKVFTDYFFGYLIGNY